MWSNPSRRGIRPDRIREFDANNRREVEAAQKKFETMQANCSEELSKYAALHEHASRVKELNGKIREVQLVASPLSNLMMSFCDPDLEKRASKFNQLTTLLSNLEQILKIAIDRVPQGDEFRKIRDELTAAYESVEKFGKTRAKTPNFVDDLFLINSKINEIDFAQEPLLIELLTGSDREKLENN
ncbi:unnamed protein product [Caenorhabditis bovis]|uniref:Uncharacterized protein n=1 Tax=Caenorhabditis bovis TaxID=2654633 RepID=A0A8S1EA37_9PELO|nr:unnamed protein product [Caenorhabditis bovis]